MPEKTSEIKAVMEKPFKLQPNSFEISQKNFIFRALTIYLNFTK